MKSILFIIVSFLTIVSNAQNTDAVRDIAQRNFSWLVPYLEFKLIPSETKNDYFTIEKKGKKICISGNNNNALSRGLGHYLRFVAHRSISHLSDNISKPKKIVYPTEKIEIISPFEYRYALNYCTLSYSMSFYTWEDWKRQLDWFALNGVNMVLMPLGTEIIWFRTLQQLGYTPQEAKKYIASPTFSAWWQMGNLEGWYGTITDEVMEEQRQLAHKVFERMKILSIEPIYQGFYANVSTSLKTKFPVKVVEQGLWAGGFQRPDMIDTHDEYFSKISDIYYSEIKKEYGDFKYFGGDPFHEGGRVGDIDVSKASKHIQQKMQEHFKGSKWLLQGWGENPTDLLLKGVDKKSTIILELEGENTANWEKRKAYGGIDFIWCQISNFGAKTGLYGKLQRFADEVYRLQTSQYLPYAKGIGIIPEGIHNNPIVYDFTLDLAWYKKGKEIEKINVNDYIDDYMLYRYGKITPPLKEAWQLLLETAYKSHKVSQQGAPESMLCARPSLQVKSVSSWGTIARQYEYEMLKKAVKLFISAEKDFKNIPTYHTDKIDLLRQLNSDKSIALYKEIQQSIEDKNLKKFIQNKDKFLELIEYQDELLSVDSHFRLNTFLQQAIEFSKDKKSQELALKNAKVQISYWGTDTNPSTNLRDYAHKEWNGMLKSLYYHRWQSFFNYQQAILEGKQATEPNYYQMELDWASSVELYNNKPISPKRLQKIITSILE